METAPVEIDCKNLRKERQKENNRKVSDALTEKDEKSVRRVCNGKELDRVLDELELSFAELIEKCDDIYFKKLLAGRIAKSASRQGCRDEAFVLDICNNTTTKFGIEIKKLSNTAWRPVKNGKIVNHQQAKKLKKHDCLKSFDAKIKGKMSGWIFAKITFSNGGHQDNVFEEAHQFCKWAITHGVSTETYVVLIDTDLKKQFNDLKAKYCQSNLLIVDHISFQQYVIDHYATKETKSRSQPDEPPLINTG